MGPVVLKRVVHPLEAEFVATVSAALPMVARPLAAPDGGWVHEGWTATAWVDAHPAPERWDAVLATGRDLHAALLALDPSWPRALDARAHPWAIADHVAWGEEGIPAAVTGRARSVVERALVTEGSEARVRQVVHGDLAGNVLFPTGGPPVVIDLSPYWRPVEFAEAVTILDQVCWHGAPAERTALVDPRDLGRAIVFRVVAAALQSEAAAEDEAQRAEPLLG